ncbi:MAG: hypothetical protein ACT4OK_13415 [Gemmobacter sp.]
MRAVLALLLSLAASPAAALSCLDYDLRSAFWRHMDRPETYVLAWGNFGDLGPGRHDKAADTVTYRAFFAGNTASSRGFDQPFGADVVITDRLFSGIAGGERPVDALARGLPGVVGLVFLRRTADGYTLETGLCEPVVDTDPANKRRAVDCLNGRRCARPAAP